MSFETIIKNGSIVTATDTYRADIAIANGKVAAVGSDLPVENASKVIDAANKLVLPGGIDVHTHLDMPFGGTTSADDFETGNTCGRFWRDDHPHRFRDSVQGPATSSGIRYLDEQSSEQGR